MATFLLFFSLILLSLSSSALASPRTSFLNAAEILSHSGYLSMALTLQITSNTLNLESKAVTIFAPSDPAFVQQGQPSLLGLQYHISPIRLSIDSLKNLSIGTRIPTLVLNHSLTVTTTSLNFKGQLSVDNVLIQESAIFDDDSVVIYGIDKFFNPSFDTSPVSAPKPSPSSTSWVSNASQRGRRGSSGFDITLFCQASDLLMSRGYTIMATFLDMQVVGFTNDTRLTIFAPVDEVIEAYVRNVSDYSLLFRKHVVPRLLSWTDLVRLDDGTMLPTFSGGFMINKTRSGDVLVLNDVPVIFPDMYNSAWLIVHGINQLLMSPAKQGIIGDSFSELNGDDEQNPPDYSEYGAP